LFAAPLAVKLHLPLLLIRKKGKLPGKTYACEYALEYGSATMEAHQADIKRGGQYLVIDDLIATGGTLAACKNILNQGGASVAEFCAVIGLSEFPYQKALSPTPVTTLITY
jgi:adenine phosphoribosyltransferase